MVWTLGVPAVPADSARATRARSRSNSLAPSGETFDLPPTRRASSGTDASVPDNESAHPASIQPRGRTLVRPGPLPSDAAAKTAPTNVDQAAITSRDVPTGEQMDAPGPDASPADPAGRLQAAAGANRPPPDGTPHDEGGHAAEAPDQSPTDETATDQSDKPQAGAGA